MASVRVGMGMVIAASLFFVVGCGGDPLEGSWSTSTTAVGITTKQTWDFKSDMTASVSAKITNTPAGVTCNGSIDYKGFDWSSTDTHLTISGSGSCTTSLVCMVAGQNVPSQCQPTGNVAGSCNYKLSSDQNTLDLTNCTSKTFNGDVTFTRDM
jgi:hypothetical protein